MYVCQYNIMHALYFRSQAFSIRCIVCMCALGLASVLAWLLSGAKLFPILCMHMSPSTSASARALGLTLTICRSSPNMILPIVGAARAAHGAPAVPSSSRRWGPRIAPRTHCTHQQPSTPPPSPRTRHSDGVVPRHARAYRPRTRPEKSCVLGVWGRDRPDGGGSESRKMRRPLAQGADV
jgi:hypothetical protein